VPAAGCALDSTGRFPTAASPFGLASGKDTNTVRDNSAAERLEGGLPQHSGSRASGAAGVPAWLSTTPSGTPFGGLPAVTPKLKAGDLLKPFVVYLQVSRTCCSQLSIALFC
jgi:hypothetical protein